MENYKPNSFLSKEKDVKSEKKVKKAITGVAKVKEKSNLQKLIGMFISEDIGNVKSFIIMDVIIPAAKKAILDVITNGTDMLLYGDSGRKKQTTGSKASYQSYYAKPQNTYSNRKTQNVYDFDNLLFETRDDANSVLDSLQEIINNYNAASVADLYDLSDVTIENTAAENYGWSNISDSKVVRVPEGYVLKLPKPSPIH